MRRRALRAPFVVTFALGAAAIASACGGKGSGNANGGDGGNVDGNTGDGSDLDGSNVDGTTGDASASCPADPPMQGTPCDVPYACSYGGCSEGSSALYAYCQQGIWSESYGACNPPPVLDAGPDVYDAAPDVDEGGHD